MEKENPNFFVKMLMLLGYVVIHPLVWLWRKLSKFFGGLNYRRIGSRIVHTVGDFLHWVIFKVLLPKKYRNITKKEIYRIIFKADTPAGKKFDIWLLVMTFACQIGAHAVFNWVLGYVTPLFLSTWGNAEIVISTLLALVVFGEIPTLLQVVGGAITIVGLLIYNFNEN